MKIVEFLKEQKQIVDEALDRLVPPEDKEPGILYKAMRYTLMAGGKRIRPILLLESYKVSDGKNLESALYFACAVELVHTFSLIHDDLPAMDNDDYRRGKPANHKVFGEAIAILAGDALFSYAIELALKAPVESTIKIKALEELVKAIGPEGMIAGQVLDIKSEGKEPTPELVLEIHSKKTASLISSSMAIGGILAGANYETVSDLRKAGYNLGIAFQIIDDILDEIGKEEELGKRAHKDLERGKCTYPKVYGIKISKEHAKGYIQKAKDILESRFGLKAKNLMEIANFIITRSF